MYIAVESNIYEVLMYYIVIEIEITEKQLHTHHLPGVSFRIDHS